MGVIISKCTRRKTAEKADDEEDEKEEYQLQNEASLILPVQLCSACSQLDLEGMLGHETEEHAIGFLADYLTPDCPFCDLVAQSVRLAWGDGWSTSRVCSETETPIRAFIRSQSPLSAKINGRMQHPQPRILLAIDQKPPSFQRNRATLRQLDRGKSRFIIAEIEQLPGKVPSTPVNFCPRREVSQEIDVGLIQTWLTECRTHNHSQQSPSPGSQTLFHEDHPFRLIDVVEECLVSKSNRCEYVALSYVWGQVPTILFPGKDDAVIPILLTTRDNVKQNSTAKSLSQLRQVSRTTGRVPRTVRDAMEMTRRIGMRYLWVDTLCIVQDDPDDKARIIGQMADVYDNATMTLVAAAGGDADAGLSGISPRLGQPLNPAQITTINGNPLSLSLCLSSLCDEVRGATWNTRGWTFQEQSLSQRCLYLTSEEIFFNCSEAQWREGYDYGEEKRSDGVALETRTGPPWWNRNLRKDPDPTPYHYLGHGSQSLAILGYQKAVQDYSRRKLTFQQDILSAFEGIFNRFQQQSSCPDLNIRETQSLPTQFTHLALLWFPGDGTKRRSVNSDEKSAVESKNQFASWSWVSYIGPIEFIFAESLWLTRNISHGVLKRAPLYVPITRWYFGTQTPAIWSHDVWKTATATAAVTAREPEPEPEPYQTKDPKPDELLRTTTFLADKIGLDVTNLLNYPAPSPLEKGNLGFYGAYLPSSKFHLSLQINKRVSKLTVSAHRGEFRFDDLDENNRVDELVPIVVGTTITKTPDTHAIFLGVVTENGISRRVGVGFIYLSKDEEEERPGWEYRFFCLR
ncbi:HET-domain-containing protein [Aspergillus ellipticus CBS 707.79]|uniref:HET-domain-containing protein n=1 Tax=Aspergillus ellipticus CBS 707.79 TaxID=1448320 RepID=A0A319EBE5_9EURO|nr:HET-domain-containing protein [Aspergillus ellipticus CBS 707.79]